MKRIITAILALTFTAGLVSCGKSENSSDSDSSAVTTVSLEVVPIDESEMISEEEDESSFEEDSSHTDEQSETVIEVTDDKLTEDEAKDMVDKALKAYSVFDLENLYKYSDLSYLYSKDGKNVSFEEFEKNMQSILDDAPKAEYDYTLTSAEEDLEMLAILGNAVSPDAKGFTIDGCWRVGSTSEGYGDSSIYILHINGEWLTDFVFTVYSDFSNISVEQDDTSSKTE